MKFLVSSDHKICFGAFQSQTSRFGACKENLRMCERWLEDPPPPRYEYAHRFNGFFCKVPLRIVRNYNIIWMKLAIPVG